jgi:hypothetical protein
MFIGYYRVTGTTIFNSKQADLEDRQMPFSFIKALTWIIEYFFRIRRSVTLNSGSGSHFVAINKSMLSNRYRYRYRSKLVNIIKYLSNFYEIVLIFDK